jgi:hypothetical protein
LACDGDAEAFGADVRGEYLDESGEYVPKVGLYSG